MDLEMKKYYAENADEIVEDQVVQEAMQEFADNMRFKLEGLPSMGLHKVASYAAQIALARADGYTSDDLLR